MYFIIRSHLLKTMHLHVNMPMNTMCNKCKTLSSKNTSGVLFKAASWRFKQALANLYMANRFNWTHVTYVTLGVGSQAYNLLMICVRRSVLLVHKIHESR
ncbi:hypothetical protein EGR_10750 [Echinococcus granulosus]|uniref:Uncharacterized protein n=1 Tax=Echinococcus granulosus TaxID=6210 RepID=W6U044_ECHGR|nr:hypothetical protein EGR_10750 [Echinococcus granulosus]EUB54393.1 hypothetical protein EGR_10750 [Echinococcus granulosus]